MVEKVRSILGAAPGITTLNALGIVEIRTLKIFANFKLLQIRATVMVAVAVQEEQGGLCFK